jgi:hypothetical protein
MYGGRLKTVPDMTVFQVIKETQRDAGWERLNAGRRRS